MLMTSCQRSTLCPTCGEIPRFPDGEILYRLFCPTAHTATKIARLLELPRGGRLAGGSDLAVKLARLDLERLAPRLRAALSARELDDIRTLALPENEAVRVDHLGQVGSLRALLARVEERQLYERIEAGRTSTYFQPIVDIHQPARVVGHEALFRCFDADGRALPAGPIFDAAREAGLLVQVDLLARRSALVHAARAGLEGGLFINFAPSAIYDPDFCLRSTTGLAHELGLDPDQIVFEVVESDHVADLRHLRSILQVYRERGFKIALDDFGAGFSSFNLLQAVRPDIIKLDMELVRGVADDAFKASLARATVSVAREHGITTLAEGIETEAEHRFFRDLGVDLAQGYLFGRPGPMSPRAASADGQPARPALATVAA